MEKVYIIILITKVGTVKSCTEFTRENLNFVAMCGNNYFEKYEVYNKSKENLNFKTR